MYKLPYWVTKSTSPDGLMIFNWKNNKSAIVFDKNHPVYGLDNSLVLHLHAQLSEEHAEDINWLVDEGFLIKTGESEREPGIKNSKSEDNNLHLILLPAGEACNLDCVYCYEDHSYKKRMDEESARKLIEFIKIKNPSRLNIEYFGGEPMLNLKFINHFSECLDREGFDFYGSITTNGTLINEKTLKILYTAGVRSFQITIDGPKNLHNKLRVSKNNTFNSYDSVYNGLETIAKSDYKDIVCIVRINSNEETIREKNISEFLNALLRIIPPSDSRFLFLPKPIGDYLSANLKENLRAIDTYCNKGSISEVVDVLEDKFEEVGYLLADPAILTKKGGYSCYAGNANSFVVNPDLNLMKCTVAMDDPVNTVGHINDGNYELNDNFSLWTKNFADSNCEKCFANETCTGNSCPLVNIKDNQKNCPPIKQDVQKATIKAVKFYERISDENF